MNLLTGLILAMALVLPHDAPDVAVSAPGAEHPATAMMLRNVALGYAERGQYVRAEATAKRALATLEAWFGGNDVSLTPVLNVLTETYAAQGRLIDARRVAMRAVEIGPGAEVHYATALHNAGAVFEMMGDFENARTYYKHALLERETWLGTGHPYVALTRAAVARVEVVPR